jgi:membrane-bound ClpP family serine protease
MNLLVWMRAFFSRDAAVRPGGSHPDHMIGRTGITTTPLNAGGIADFDGEHLDVICRHGYVARHTPVRIVGRYMSWWVVLPVRAQAA